MNPIIEGKIQKKIQLYVIIKSEVNEVNKILIVEDEQSIAEMVKLCLCKNGYMCEIVNDGMAATQKIEEKRYDLILLDIMLPDIDGYDLIEYIKQFDIPVIFVTAKTSVPDRVKGLKLGAEDYIFQNQKGKAYHYSSFRWSMKKIFNENHELFQEYNFKSHDFRHTIATMFYEDGVPLQSVRDYLGHDYEEMTQQYVDYMPKRISRANQELFAKEGSSLASGIKRCKRGK